MSDARRLIEAESPKSAFLNNLPRWFSFHFDLGNSATGAVGFAARVRARTPDDAVRILQDMLPEEMKLPVHFMGSEGGIEYANVYFNTRAITVDNIDEQEPSTSPGS